MFRRVVSLGNRSIARTNVRTGTYSSSQILAKHFIPFGAVSQPRFISYSSGNKDEEIMQDTAQQLDIKDGYDFNPNIADPTLPDGVAETALSLAEQAGLTPTTGSPVGLLQDLLNHLHVTYDLPWWLTIIGSTLFIRTAILPIAVYTTKNALKMSMMKPEMDHLTARFNEQKAQPDFTADKMAAHQAKIQAMMTRHDVSPFRSVAMPIAQAPIFMTYFFALREIGDHFWDVREGGVGWVTDLSMNDPTYALPILCGLSLLLVIESGAETGGTEQSKTIRNVMRGVSVIMVPLIGQLPSGVFFYMLTANLYSLIQGRVLKLSPIRKALGIPTQDEIDYALKESEDRIRNERMASQPKTYVNRRPRRPPPLYKSFNKPQK